MIDKGSFSNYVEKIILPFLTIYTPPLTFPIVWTLTKSGHFWITYIPILCFDIKLTHKWQFYDHFRQFLCLMYVYLSQNWGSDGHFNMLNGSKFWLVQKLWHKMQIFPFPVPITYIKKMKICVFCFFAFFVISLELIKI